MRAASSDHTHDVLIAGGSLPGFAAAARELGFERSLALPDDIRVEALDFDATADLWQIRLTSGEVHCAHVVVLGPKAASAAPLGVAARRYLGLTARGVPNLFVVTGEDLGIWRSGRRRSALVAQQNYVLGVLRDMRRRESTRVEVRPHVQADYDRRWDTEAERPERSFKARTKRPAMGEYEFTTHEDRLEEDEDLYDGPATLSFAEGDVLDVRVRVIAQYEPIANTIHWRGRVSRSDELRARHTEVYQPVTLQVGSRPPVAAHLVEEDPWGGSTIVGSGASPYETPLEIEYAALFGSAQGANES